MLHKIARLATSQGSFASGQGPGPALVPIRALSRIAIMPKGVMSITERSPSLPELSAEAENQFSMQFHCIQYVRSWLELQRNIRSEVRQPSHVMHSSSCCTNPSQSCNLQHRKRRNRRPTYLPRLVFG
jgi:hypothetical protein